MSVLANSRSRSSSGRPIVRRVVFRIATRSQRRSASSRRWVVRKIVTPLLPEPVDQLVDVAGGDRIQAGGRLVEEQHLRVAEQRPRQRDPLAQALGQRAARIAGPVGQVDGPQGAVDALARVGDLVEVGEALEVLGHAQAEVEARRLRHDRDPPADLDSVLRRERDSGDSGRPRRRCDQRAERPDGRRLAGAVRPQEPEHLAVVDLEGDVLERDPITEALAQIVHGQRRSVPLPAGLRRRRAHSRNLQRSGCDPERAHRSAGDDRAATFPAQPF